LKLCLSVFSLRFFFGVLRGLERPSTRLKLTRTRYTFSLIKEQVPGPKFGSEDAS